MDIYSFLAEGADEARAGALSLSADDQDQRLMTFYGSSSDPAEEGPVSISVDPHLDGGMPGGEEVAMEDAASDLNITSNNDPKTTPLQQPITSHQISKSDFSVLSTYRWGTYGAGEGLLSEEMEGSDQHDEEIECLLDGEDEIVVLSSHHHHGEPPSSTWSLLGGGIFSIANNTAKKAGDIVYYAASSVGEAGSRIRATISRTADTAIVTVAGDAAAETLMFAIDRSRVLGHDIVNTLRGDPESSRRLHLRRLLASGSWAEFSEKCQLATLPWYDRQLIHLTRYDDGPRLGSQSAAKIQSSTRKYSSFRTDPQRIEGRDERRALPPVVARKRGEDLSSRGDSEPCSAGAKALAVHGYGDGDRCRNSSGNRSPDPTQLDTIILSQEEVQYLNTISGKLKGDKDVGLASESDVLTDAEFHRWILEKARSGNPDAEYALSKWFTPPLFMESEECSSCQAAFGLSKFRHHCRHCGRSFCGEHSSQNRVILKYGMVYPVRVCDSCAYTIDRESRWDRQLWKKERLGDYLNHDLIPYFELAVDRGVDKAARLGLGTLYAVRNAGMALTYPAIVAAEAIEILRKYGLAGLAGILLRNDFMEAVEALKQITSMDERYPLSIRQLTACIYYKLAIERGLRGCDPDGEQRAHVAAPENISGQRLIAAGPSSTDYIKTQREAERHSARLCREVDDGTLSELIRYSSQALFISYEENSVESQRLAELQGFKTLISNPVSEPEKPAYALFVCSGEQDTPSTRALPVYRREAVLAIRGTHTIQDVVTDLRAVPIVFPPSREEVDGIMNGSIWVRDKNASGSLVEGKVFAEEIYITEEVGWHAPVADVEYACRGVARASLNMLHEVGPTLIGLHEQGHEIRIVGHSLGGAVASLLALLLEAYIPRIKALAYSPPCFVSSGLAEKMEGFVHTLVLHDDIICRVSPESIRLLMKELIVFRDKVFKFVEQDWYDAIKRAGSVWTPRWRNASSYVPRTRRASMTTPMQRSQFTSRANSSSARLIDGGIGTVVVGEDDTVVSPPGSAMASIRVGSRDGQQSKISLNALSYIADMSGSVGSRASENDSTLEGEEEIFFDGQEGDRAVIIGDTVIAKLNVPGRVFHIYSYRGVYRISEVPRTFPSLNKIEIQGDIFNDHRSATVYDALLEVRSVRAARCSPPQWTPYDASATCQRCKSSFTWHTTCQGDAQELRERYNCVSCGSLVCGPCSSRMLPVPRLGLNMTARVCDACFHMGHHMAPFNPPQVK